MSAPSTPGPSPYAKATGPLVLNGWWPLPLPARSKKHPPKGYTGADGRQPSVDDLNTWMRTSPDGNVAVRLPPDVVGIDVDAYGDKPGWQTFQQLQHDHGALPASVIVTSRDDGHSGIRLFRLPDGVDQARFRTGWPGIEILRYGHRYVIAPPSIHPDTGQPYQCIDETTGEVLASLPPKTDLPLLPDTWAAACTKADRESTAYDPSVRAVPSQVSTGVHGDPYAPCKAMSAALADILEQHAGGGSRHDVATAGALRLARLADLGHHGGTYALDRLGREHVNAISSDRASRGEAVREWASIVESALDRVAETPTPEAAKGCCGPDSLAARQTAAADRWLAQLPGGATLSSSPAADPEGEAENAAGEDRTSWWPRDLTGALTGTDVEPEPTHLARDDGRHLFYAGKVNGLIGESESGKTWVALLAVHQALTTRRSVLYLDFEDTPTGIITRLRAMGATDDDLDHLVYIGPDEALGIAQRADLAEALTLHAPELIVLDGFNAAMTLMGLEINDNGDATRFAQLLLRPLSLTGAAVVYVDHVPKSTESRGKGGIGAQAKRAMTTGCALLVDVKAPFGRGQTGRLRLTVDKDRPGHVRAISGGAKYAGEVELHSDDLTGAVTVRIANPDLRPLEERGPFRPTHLMERVSVFLATVPGGASKNDITAGVTGNKKAIGQALDVLVDEGYVERAHGPNRAVIHRRVRPYYEADDLAEGTSDDVD